MKSILSIFCAIVLCGLSQVSAQESEVELTVYRQPAPNIQTEYRLLPNDIDVVDGNAAVVILRVVYDEDPYTSKVRKDLKELMEMNVRDPRLAKFFSTYPFEKQFQRAAHMRYANWEYDLNSRPLYSILLPDANSMQLWLKHVYAMRIDQQIIAQDFDGALANMQAQLACAQHLGRTPFLVLKSIENSTAKSTLHSLDLWMSQPESPNLYWALSMLPEPLMNMRAAWDREANFILGSFTTLDTNNLPEVGSPIWKSASDEFSRMMIDMMQVPMERSKAIEVQNKATKQSELELVSRYGYDESTVGKMLPEEKLMRWMLKETEAMNAKVLAFVSMHPREALPRLVEVEKEATQRKDQLGTPELPFVSNSIQFYLMPYHFDRWANQLQTLESIRHHLATHDNKLPATLADLELPAPLDPLTGLSFEYELKDDKAILRTPIFKGFEEQTKGLFREYVITVSK